VKVCSASACGVAGTIPLEPGAVTAPSTKTIHMTTSMSGITCDSHLVTGGRRPTVDVNVTVRGVIVPGVGCAGPFIFTSRNRRP